MASERPPTRDLELDLFNRFCDLPPESWQRCLNWMGDYAFHRKSAGIKAGAAIQNGMRAACRALPDAERESDDR